MWRPTPLYRALGLEQALGTACRIFYKYEGVSPAGQPQAQHLGAPGVLQPRGGGHPPRHRDRRRPVGLGAGVRLRALRPRVQGLHGAGLVRPEALPALDDPHLGRRGRAEPLARTRRPAAGSSRPTPTAPAAWASRSARPWRTRPRATTPSTRSAACSTTSCCTRRSSGQEAREQLARPAPSPDVIIGCVGGGSNFAGLAFPFLAEKAAGKDIRIVAAEPAACPTLTRGHYGYDFGDTAKMAPLLAMHTLGHGFVPPAIHSGGLRYHGMAPLVSRTWCTRAWSRRAPTTRASASRRPCASRAPRASSRRPSPRTRCGPWSRRSSGPARRASSARSSSTSAATGTSTWPPTTRSCPAR